MVVPPLGSVVPCGELPPRTVMVVLLGEPAPRVGVTGMTVVVPETTMVVKTGEATGAGVVVFGTVGSVVAAGGG